MQCHISQLVFSAELSCTCELMSCLLIFVLSYLKPLLQEIVASCVIVLQDLTPHNLWLDLAIVLEISRYFFRLLKKLPPGLHSPVF